MKLTKENIFPIFSSDDCDKAVCLLEQVSDIDREDHDCEDVFNIIKILIANWDSSQSQLTRPAASEILKTFMESENVTQERLAAATGIRQPNISRCLSGRYKMSLKNADKFATFFNVDRKLFLSIKVPNLNKNPDVVKRNFIINEHERNFSTVYFSSNNIHTPYSIQSGNVINISDQKRRT